MKIIRSIMVSFIVLCVVSMHCIPEAEAEEYPYGDIEGDPIVSVTKLKSEEIEEEISAEVIEEETEAETELVTYIVELEAPCVIDAGLIPGSREALAYGDRLRAAQESAEVSMKEAAVSRIGEAAAIKLKMSNQFINVINGFSITLPSGMAAELEAIPGVKCVFAESYYLPPETLDDEYDPAVFSSADMIGRYETNASGYTGKGMVIGVLDTALDVSHPAFSRSPENQKITSDTEFEGLIASKTWYSEKIPFAYDYAGNDSDVTDDDSHGTHVTGIAAGNDDVIQGIVPDAQIAFFKVFSDGFALASNSSIISALEDAVIVRPDVLNLSLGVKFGDKGLDVQNTFHNEKIALNEIYNRVYYSGILVNVSAGNDRYVGSVNISAADRPKSGTVSSPSTYSSPLSVASAVNTTSTAFNMTVSGKKYYFTDPLYTYPDKRFDTVHEVYGSRSISRVGTGTAEEMEKNGQGGNVFMALNGTESISVLQNRAALLGASGLIICNNKAGTMNREADPDSIPVAILSNAEGQKLYNTGGVITEIQESAASEIPDSYEISSFSSWGSSCDLELKPEITAPGSFIFSAVPGGYDSMSGTSMAAPETTGALTLVRQHIRETYDSLSENETDRIANCLLMSTAHILNNPDSGNPYSPRAQGAGLINIHDAIASYAYLSVSDTFENRPKIELGSDIRKTGEYTLSFNITNISDAVQTYDVSSIVMSDSVNGIEITREGKMLEHYISGDSRVIVGPQETKAVTCQISLSAAAKNYLDTSFPRGDYVERYILLDPVSSEDTTKLSIPFMGFYDDMSTMPLLDLDMTKGATAEIGTNGFYTYFGERRYLDHWAAVPLYPGINIYEKEVLYKGDYFRDIQPEYILTSSVINPQIAELVSQNGSLIKTMDLSKNTGIYAASLANLQELNWFNYRVLNKNTGEVYFDKGGMGAKAEAKSDVVDDSDWGDFLNLVRWPGTDASGYPLEEGTECLFEVQASKDGGKTIESSTVPFTIDNSKPFITGTAIQDAQDEEVLPYMDAELVTTESGRKFVRFTAYDNYYLQAARVAGEIYTWNHRFSSNGGRTLTYTMLGLRDIKDTVTFSESKPGQLEEVLLDVTDFTAEEYYVALSDYTNFTTYYHFYKADSVMTIDPADSVFTLNDDPVYQQYTVRDGRGNIIDSERLTWSVDGKYISYGETSIDENGLLYIDQKEQSQTLTVKVYLDSNRDNYVTATVSLIKTDSIEIQGHSLALNGRIGINVYLIVPKEKTASSNVELTFNGKKMTTHLQETYLVGDYEYDENKEVRRLTYLTAAKEMWDNLEIVIRKTDTGSARVIRDTLGYAGDYYDYRVLAYLYTAIEKGNEKLKNLATAMMNYGSWAMEYFNYKSDEYYYESPDVSEVTPADVDEYQTVIAGSAAGISYTGGSIILETDTGFRLYFTLDSGHSIGEYTFTVDGKSVKPVQKSAGSAMYYVETVGVGARNLGQSKTITVSDGKDQLQIQYSVLSYVYTALTSPKASETLKNVCRALYLYGQKAKEYLN